MELSCDELNILRNAFDSSDIDGDGVLSKQDIRLSSGLKTDEEVDGLFQAIKDADSLVSCENGDVITFDEFQKSFVDFPILLEHFKQEYEDMVAQECEESDIKHQSQKRSNKSSAHYDSGKEHNSDQTSEGSDKLIDENSEEQETLIDSKLSMALQFFQRANKLDISSPLPESDSETSDEDIVEDLLDDLQAVPESISLKIKNAFDKDLISDSQNALFQLISSGLVSIVNAVIELHNENDAQYLELHKNVPISRKFVSSLKKKCDELTKKNRELTVQIFNIEEEQLSIQKERVQILKQTKDFKESLDQAIWEKSSSEARLDNLLDQFIEKEQAMLQAQQEARRLRNLKSLHEISAELADPESATKVRLFRQKTIGGINSTMEYQRQRTIQLQHQVTSLQRRSEYRKLTVLDWQKQNKKRQLDELKHQLIEGQQKLYGLEEEETTIESLNQKIKLLQQTNTGLILQLQQEKNWNTARNKFNEFESSDEGVHDNLSNELFDISSRLSMKPADRQISQPYTLPDGKFLESETLQMDWKPLGNTSYPSQQQPWICAHCSYINDTNWDAWFSCGQRKAKEKYAWICSACDAHNMWCNKRCWKWDGLGSGTNVLKAVGAMTMVVPLTFGKIMKDWLFK